MPTVADFQNYAAVCTRLARATDTEASKTTLLMMAEKWSGLAAQAERVRQLVREADALFDASTSAPERLSDLSLSFDAHAAPSRRDA